MKYKKFVLPIIIIIAPILVLLLICSALNSEFIKSYFYPVYDNMDSSVSNTFLLKKANYSSGHIFRYYLEYDGDEENFLDSCIKFSNDFYETIPSDDNALKHEEYKFVFSCGEKYIIYWKTNGSKTSCTCTIQTNVFCDCSLFDGFNGLYALRVDVTKFTKEQISYVSEFSDRFSFDISICLDKSNLLY